MGRSFSLSGGAAHGVAMTGALVALRQRGVLPTAVAGVSSGAMAAALAYGPGDRAHHLGFFQEAFALVRDRSAVRALPRTLLPPWDTSGDATLRVLRPWLFAPRVYREVGLRSLWVGVATFPRFGFERLDVLADDDEAALGLHIARSSMMPFLTHDTLHLQNGLDGAFRNNHFVPPDADGPRWLFTYAKKPLTSGRGPRRAYDRVILLESPFRFALDLDLARIGQAWDEGYRQGARLKI